MRRAFKAFDDKFETGIGKKILDQYFIDGGKALSHGATGVQVGSVFVLAEESGMKPTYRTAILVEEPAIVTPGNHLDSIRRLSHQGQYP